MNNLVTKIYSPLTIEKYQNKINFLGSYTKLKVSNFLISRLVIEIIIFILFVLIPKYGLYISGLAVLVVHILYEDILITSNIINREKQIAKDAYEFFKLLSLGLNSNSSLYFILLNTSKICNNSFAKEFIIGLKNENVTYALNYVINHIPNRDLKDYLSELKLEDDFKAFKLKIDKINEELRGHKESQNQNVLVKLPIKIILITIVFLTTVLLLILVGPKYI